MPRQSVELPQMKVPSLFRVAIPCRSRGCGKPWSRCKLLGQVSGLRSQASGLRKSDYLGEETFR